MTSKSIHILNLILSGDFFSKFILSVLFLSSIFSWAVILERFFMYRSVRKKMIEFDKHFISSSSLDSLYQDVKNNENCPFSLIFINAIGELNNVDNKNYSSNGIKSLKERVIYAMYKAKTVEMSKMDSFLNILALIGSKSPFVGLLGTVWGIMNSFQAIAISKNNSLSVVAPGIAEALFITAIGLCVSIPSIIAYNIFVSKVNNIESKMTVFISRLYNLFSRILDNN